MDVWTVIADNEIVEPYLMSVLLRIGVLISLVFIAYLYHVIGDNKEDK